MEVIYLKRALEDLEYWKNTGNKKVQKRIVALITAIENEPFSGLGKPELLKYDLSGKWSRRISEEHRVVYEIKNEKILIYSLKGHY
jgi:toxin YoeB